MTLSVTVEYGLQDWEIKCQKDGKADIVVGGSYIPSESPDSINKIWLRILEEDTGIQVTPWQTADKGESHSVVSGMLRHRESRL